MSADFKPVLVKDSRINDITDVLDYAVHSGASSNTYQQFPSVSASSSSVSFNIQVPSESIVISREVLIDTDIHFTINVSNVPLGQTAFNYGVTDALQAFPFSSLLTTLNASINNTSVSINLQDVLPALLRLNDSRQLYKYNGMTPSLPDQAYKFFSDGVATNNNALAGYTNSSYDVDLLPRGAHPVSIVLDRYVAGVLTDNSPVSTGLNNSWIISCVVHVTEPVFLSPFIFGNPEYNKAGMVGINNMNFVMNIDSTCKRFFSTANSAYTYSVSLGTAVQPQPFQNCKMLLNFLSTQPTDLVPARNVLPYMDFPRYLSLATSNPNIPAGASSTIVTNSVQLNQLPDYFIIMVRKPMSAQSVKDATCFLPINSISVNLNNTSGLLSSATQQDLWRISVANNSTQNWEEFSGRAFRPNNATGVGSFLATTGSLLILSPARDLSLPSYLSSGSIGQYVFQANINVTNNELAPLTPEVVVICVNSGIFTTLAGSSSIFTGVLTKQMVLDAQQEEGADALSSVTYQRLVGGVLSNQISSAMKRIPFKKARRVLEALPAKVRSMGSKMVGGKLDALCL
jgi:hypothetical protein